MDANIANIPIVPLYCLMTSTDNRFYHCLLFTHHSFLVVFWIDLR
jgi:hypothetical protein